MIHIVSGLDNDAPESVGSGAVSASITGYTEWVSPSAPSVSIGWDWELTGYEGRLRVCRVGTPRHNVMCIAESGRDAGPRATRLVVARFLERFSWQPTILDLLAQDPKPARGCSLHSFGN